MADTASRDRGTLTRSGLHIAIRIVKEPTFILIGAARCGTTSMARWLDAHPKVFVTKPKEVFFFSHHGNYTKGWEHYLELYTPAGDAVALGEATTDYANTEKYPWIVDRIAQHLPDARLIFMVRHPLERIASQWELSRSLGSTNLSLSEAVFAHPELIQMSRYLRTMESYLHRFSREQMHVVLFDDFQKDPRTAAATCLRFLDVDPLDLPDLVERAPNRGDRLRRSSLMYRRLKGSPFYTSYRRLVPTAFRGPLHMLMTNEKDWETEWETGARDHVRACLESETRLFLERYSGWDAGTWKFDGE